MRRKRGFAWKKRNKGDKGGVEVGVGWGGGGGI